MKSMKKIITIVMIAGLMIACFAISASAKSDTFVDLRYDGEIHITGKPGDETDASYAEKTYGITWDANEKAWVFNNTQITKAIMTDADKGEAIRFSGDCTVIIKGTCSVYAPGERVIYSMAFDDGDNVSDANLVIKGNGTLNIDGESTGIASKGSITISDSVKLNINSGYASIRATYNSNDITFKGNVDVNCFAKNKNAIIASHDVIFELASGGRVHAETQDEEDCSAIIAVSKKTIKLNDSKIVEPAGGYVKEKDGDYAVFDANDKEAKIVTIENTGYEIKEEAQTAYWKIGGKDGAVLTSTASYSTFEAVTVDGKALTEGTDFTKSEGSTIITFLPAFLDKLSVGKHEVVIKSTYGSATGYLIVADDKIVQTGDNNAIGAFAAVGVFAAAAFVSLKKKEN